MTSIMGMGTFDNSGIVRCYNGTLAVRPSATWLSTGGTASYRTLASDATILFPSPGPTIPASTTNFFTGPGIADLPYGGTVAGVLQVGEVDPVSQALTPGALTLSSEAVMLGGPGLVHVVANSSSTSKLDWMGGTISLAEVDVDAGGELNLSGSADKYLSGTAVINAGTTTTKTDGVALRLNAGSVFNNVVGGLFDAQNDAAIAGSAGAIPGVFNNAGTFRKSAGTNFTFSCADASPAEGPFFNNTGLLDVHTGGVLLLAGTNAGRFNVEAGTRLRFWSGTNVQANGASFTGAGQVQLGYGAGATVLIENPKYPACQPCQQRQHCQHDPKSWPGAPREGWLHRLRLGLAALPVGRLCLG